MTKKDVLVVFPSPRDLRYLASLKISERCRIRRLGETVENPIGFDPVSWVKKALTEPKPAGIAATADYPAAFVASHLAHRMGIPGPSPESVLLCQHKYYSRIAQERVIPEAVPPFFLIPLDISVEDPSRTLSYPLFIKPVKGFLSILAGQVGSPEDLKRLMDEAQKRLKPFSEPFDRLVQEVGLREAYPIGGNHLIAEGVLTGDQVTLEGYVFQGEVRLIDIVDSIFYPGTLSFQRFQTPSRLPLHVQERMFALARRFLKSIGFNNGLFNMEFIYDPQKASIHVIEVNSRMAHQFAGMMEAVHGMNSYEVLVDIALGRCPSFQRHAGAYTVAASFVMRKFEDAVVAKVPTEEDIAAVRGLFPPSEVEILVHPGLRLSDDFRQDEDSFRYAIVNLAASNEAELLEKFQEAEKRLPFEFVKRKSQGVKDCKGME